MRRIRISSVTRVQKIKKYSSYLFMWRPLQCHSQVGSLQGGVLERLCGTPELQPQLQPK